MNGLLKFITCGSVDDGKSTLIGNILYNSKLIFTDQKSALHKDSKTGSRNSEIDYSLLLDGLMAEREQGITIDVAYRYFTTKKRSFIVADTPGHEEYTRNMAVGASFADLAIILIDATKGILTQTKRHVRICALMGISHFVFAINKMDLIDYDESLFKSIKRDCKNLMSEINVDTIVYIPVSATVGDNLSKKSKFMHWFEGKPLLNYLENINIDKHDHDTEFSMCVQRVCRPNLNFRGFQGEVAQGKLKVGDKVKILPSAEYAKIKELYLKDKSVNEIGKNMPVTIVFDRETDCSRGCVITTDNSYSSYRLFRADLLWTDDEELIIGRNYLLKIGTKIISATIMRIHYCVDVNTGVHILKEQANKNDIINCDVSISEKIVVSKFEEAKSLGRFILINRVTNMTSACGTVMHPLRRSDNLTWHNFTVTNEVRARQKNQTPMTFWFTGLSGSGKSTIVNALEQALVAQGNHTMILDGDNVRMGLSNDLGFSQADRVENIRRIAQTAKLMNDAGLIVLVAIISPYSADRQNARKIIGDCFYEVFVDTSLDECIRRDTKHLYQQAIKGQISNFTGISSPYETPQNPDIIIKTENSSVESSVLQILKFLDNVSDYSDMEEY